MNDKELADKVVALGVGGIGQGPEPVFSGFYYIPNKITAVRADSFVTDWRVAGALMEKSGPITMNGAQVIVIPSDGVREMAVIDRLDSLPRAIIEACVTALEPDE